MTLPVVRLRTHAALSCTTHVRQECGPVILGDVTCTFEACPSGQEVPGPSKLTTCSMSSEIFVPKSTVISEISCMYWSWLLHGRLLLRMSRCPSHSPGAYAAAGVEIPRAHVCTQSECAEWKNWTRRGTCWWPVDTWPDFRRFVVRHLSPVDHFVHTTPFPAP